MARTKKVGKSDNKGKSRKKTNGKANGHAKPTAEALSDAQRQSLLFRHKKSIVPLIAAAKEAADELRQAYEVAKEDGIPKKEVLLAIALADEAGVEKVKKELEVTNRVARWLGVGKQLNLFEDPSQKQRHFEDGRRAAFNDQPAKPPAHLGNADAQTWLEGHAAGRTLLNTQRITEGIRPDSMLPDNDAMQSIGGAAGDVVGRLGTEPPSHVVHG